MELKTRIFELGAEKHLSVPQLAQAMGLSASHLYRVLKRKRRINETFIIGAMKAFPGYKLEDLFYVVSSGLQNKATLWSKAMLTITNVAHVLGVHPNTVRVWSDKGILKSYRIGLRRDRMFRQEDIEDFLKRSKVRRAKITAH